MIFTENKAVNGSTAQIANDLFIRILVLEELFIQLAWSQIIYFLTVFQRNKLKKLFLNGLLPLEVDRVKTSGLAIFIYFYYFSIDIIHRLDLVC